MQGNASRSQMAIEIRPRAAELDLSLARWRADTHGCAHRNHLNNAGAALMPRPVIDAITRHIALESEIGGYEAEDARRAESDTVYDDIGALVGAPARNMAIVANATAGFIQSMSAFDLTSGDVIVTSSVDYVSYQLTFLALVKRLGVRIRHAPDLLEGGVDPTGVRDILRREKVRLV